MKKRKLAILPLEDRLAPAVGDLVHNLTPPGNSAYFGRALAMTSQYVAVGTTRDGTAGSLSGAVHLYNPVTGGLLRSILNPNPNSNDLFGESVALSGNLLAVGATQDDLNGADSGTAYLFDASTGGLLFTLNNPTPATFEFFGCSVAIAGNIVFVGAYLDNTDAGNGGSVYRFNATTGAIIDRLGSPSPAGGDYFGHSLAVSGDTLVVGAPLDEVTTPLNVGAAHLYTASTGAYLRTIANPDPDPSDWFGSSVGISGNNVVVGAHYGPQCCAMRHVRSQRTRKRPMRESASSGLRGRANPRVDHGVARCDMFVRPTTGYFFPFTNSANALQMIGAASGPTLFSSPYWSFLRP
jgi:hypothetical protein